MTASMNAAALAQRGDRLLDAGHAGSAFASIISGGELGARCRRPSGAGSSSFTLMTSPPKSCASIVATLSPACGERAGRGEAADAFADHDYVVSWLCHGQCPFIVCNSGRACAAGRPSAPVAGARLCGGGGGAVAAPRMGTKSLRILRASPMRCVMPRRVEKFEDLDRETAADARRIAILRRGELARSAAPARSPARRLRASRASGADRSGRR